MIKNNKLWVCLADLHFPKHHKPTWGAALEFIKHNRENIEGVLFLGDQFDNSAISHHNSNKPLLWEQGSYKNETEEFDRQILQPLEKALGKNSKRVWIVGNHDAWEQEWFEKNPQWIGFDRPELLNLKARGWKTVENTKTFNIGKLVTIHGNQFTGYTPVCPAKRAVESYTASVLQAHTHSPQSFTRVSPVDKDQTWMGYVSPAMCELNPSYMKNKPSSWANGISIVEIRSNGDFNCYLCISDRKTGTFSYGGRTYIGNKCGSTKSKIR